MWISNGWTNGGGAGSSVTREVVSQPTHIVSESELNSTLEITTATATAITLPNSPTNGSYLRIIKASTGTVSATASSMADDNSSGTTITNSTTDAPCVLDLEYQDRWIVVSSTGSWVIS